LPICIWHEACLTSAVTELVELGGMMRRNWLLFSFAVTAALAGWTDVACRAEIATANFRVVGCSDGNAGRQLAATCEQHRAALFQFWFGKPCRADWQVKCLIVLHPSDGSYLREVGPGGGSTVGSSLVDTRQGAMVSCRIDLRCTRDGWRDAIPHELTHVLLTEHFRGKNLPRWADEGMAILADSATKRRRHADDFRQAIRQRQQFRLVELLGMDGYPSPARWGCFYGQSADVVSYLVARKSPAEFVKFIERSMTHGASDALRSVYAIDSVAGLEASWIGNATQERPLLNAIVSGQRVARPVAVE
jgi:hypothetical protein